MKTAECERMNTAACVMATSSMNETGTTKEES
jgi:hypothetical protein